MPDPPKNDPCDNHSGDSAKGGMLENQTVLVTRAVDQAGSLCQPLEKLGASTLIQPMIRIQPPESTRDLDLAIARFNHFDWLVFVSANAVQYFLDRFLIVAGSNEMLRQKKIAAIGDSTTEKLKQLGGVEVDLVPPQFNSQSLGVSLTSVASGQTLLIPRADRRSATLTDILSQARIEFEEVVVYRSEDIESADPEIVARLAADNIDWVTITSPAIARAAIRIFGEQLRNSKIVSISPGTSTVLRELGFEPEVEASTYDMQGVVTAIVNSSRIH